MLSALGSVLTNKYAEGYLEQDTMEGGEVVDQVEQLALTEFANYLVAEYANVQPHSGARPTWLYSWLA